jgi:hypothetical protein
MRARADSMAVDNAQRKREQAHQRLLESKAEEEASETWQSTKC